LVFNFGTNIRTAFFVFTAGFAGQVLHRAVASV
jgi:hypothetical protein